MTKIPLHIGKQVWQFGMKLDEYHRRVEILQDLVDVDNRANVWAFRFGLRCPFSGRSWHIRPPGGAPCPCGYVFRYNPPTRGGGKSAFVRREDVLAVLQREFPINPVSHRRIMQELN